MKGPFGFTERNFYSGSLKAMAQVFRFMDFAWHKASVTGHDFRLNPVKIGNRQLNQ
jgi:hypothetical protein